MVKFKFFFSTPRGGHYNTHYARSKKVAIKKVDQWNKDFKGTGYSVALISIEDTDDKLPEGCIRW